MRAIRPAAMLSALVLPAVLFAASPSQGEVAPLGEPDARADSGWAKLNTKPIINIAQTDMLRTADGLLHVVYPQEVGVNDEYEHTTVSTTGAVVGHSTAVSNWGALTNDPVLLPTPRGGLQIVFGGLQDVDVNNPYSAGHLYRAVSDGSGASWAVQAEALVKSGYGYASYGTGATLLPDGTSIQGYPLNSEFTFRIGTTPLPVGDATPPDQGFGLTGSSLLHATLVQQGGNVWAAWYDQGDNNGVFVRQIYPSLGVVYKAPGTECRHPEPRPGGPDGRPSRTEASCWPTASATRPATSIGLWQLGTHDGPEGAGQQGSRLRSRSDTGPTGRLWVAWANDNEILAHAQLDHRLQLRRAAPGLGKPDKDAAIYGAPGRGLTRRGARRGQRRPGHLPPAAPARSRPEGQRRRRGTGTRRRRSRSVVTDAAAPVAGRQGQGRWREVHHQRPGQVLGRPTPRRSRARSR